MKDDPRYSVADCFETFPFSTALLDSATSDLALTAQRQALDSIGERYHQLRAQLMVANNEGLTSTYNRFHDPAATNPRIAELRRIHGEMDQAVLNAYGWSDLPTTCGCGLDQWLQQRALANQRSGATRTFVVCDAGNAIKAYVALASGALATSSGSGRFRRNMPDPIPVVLLARLAMCLSAQGAVNRPCPAGRCVRKGAAGQRADRSARDPRALRLSITRRPPTHSCCAWLMWPQPWAQWSHEPRPRPTPA